MSLGVVSTTLADPDDCLERCPVQVAAPTVQVTACAGHPQFRVWGLAGHLRPPHPAGTVVNQLLVCEKFAQTLQALQYP